MEVKEWKEKVLSHKKNGYDRLPAAEREAMNAYCERYKAFLDALGRNDWVDGVGWWDWSARLYPAAEAMSNDGYGLYGKPVEKLLTDWNEERPRG